ncbi:MAG: UDP-N-acetylmuramoyl-L-alanine--D-glutamate ligase [Flavobacteriaceae bacterium CG_4_8_14_3_um_filter_34_10]|nr:UDP-N-acetylmuramoyl-L-alanine--D-glutamate ligase [Flavobacteriia bacterium]OIP52371.1 MAG: UDP-N-acetylmuramoylalanine--D-glutamate ligase [Flavobacteriaceae bacterium CG2_30_34_30]PIQ18585.1 MAG: UDP-N-acetylmuramoyl-L-alanine--D-glutamate ligase [Flavobacteriaceae bacterium CG18_big_fil_WC_8_21_14_2_50_34_36]PIV51156.1 MAG: UDP-N-acetylmuramoyl-L-alanine--D-glutamate ligase [Flavobacteriaceae bacterium CG02_land_8_20_14_3_00_34_13]PIX10716.1 MAG: UDP-N-acetylmuramoyl-L-alanine--D-glutama
MKRLVILGAGESGIGTALLGRQKGYDVFVSDKQIIKEKYKQVLIHNEINWEENGHTEAKLFQADIVMKSPGIPDAISLIKQLKKKGIPVISEIEFAAQYTNAIIIGITGSNGKTTTATWLHYVLAKGGLNVGLAGNIGDSFAGQVAQNQRDYFVLELSSFQLDGIVDFKPHIAVLTNITPDHLDRYNYNFEEYVASKFRITQNQTEVDYFIYDADDEVLVKWLESHPIKAQKLPFSISKKIERGACINKKNITITIDNKPFKMPIKTLGLQGSHNVKNAMAAATVARILSIRKATIRECMENFQGVEHRLETVLKIQNVTYINDSKATNVNATFYALDSMTSPTIWIVGGVDKGNLYEELLPLVNEKVKAIICLGLDNKKIMNAFSNVVPLMIETDSMQDAVKAAYRVAEHGDTVLLSPACASFDLFENYEARGRQFKEAVRNL